MKSEHSQFRSRLSEAPALISQHDSRQVIADRMEALAIELRSLSDVELETVHSESALLALAGNIYSARREVDKIFGMHGFSVSPA